MGPFLASFLMIACDSAVIWRCGRNYLMREREIFWKRCDFFRSDRLPLRQSVAAIPEGQVADRVSRDYNLYAAILLPSSSVCVGDQEPLIAESSCYHRIGRKAI